MGDVPERVLRDCAGWLGFGHVDASLWFVGIEESFALARCPRVADRKQYFDLRRGFDRFEDFVEVWEDVFGRPVEGGEGGLSTRWWASAFTLAYQGTTLTGLPTSDRQQRVREYTYGDPRIGRRDGDTVMAEVYPFPKPAADDIAPYDHVWDTVEDYRADIHPTRLDAFSDAIRDSDGLECLVTYAPSGDFANPIADRFDGEQVDSWPAVHDTESFDAYRLGGDANGVLLIDAPFFGKGHISYETIQLAADRAREHTREERVVA